ncbi:hypothetical protein Nmel_018112 [Mimus melanotis]
MLGTWGQQNTSSRFLER